MAEGKKGFFGRLVEGLTKTLKTILYPGSILFSADFPPLMMIFMRRSRKH